MDRVGEERLEAQESTCEALESEFRRLHDRTATFPVASGRATLAQRRAAVADRQQKLIERVHGLCKTPDGAPDFRTALCLSGGGIRSATFCLGVLQGLARRGLLADFHYLSTVSGGGYIGGWLSSWIRRGPSQTDGPDDSLAPSTAESIQNVLGGRTEPKPVAKLRSYSNFLSPVWGISGDAMSLVATFARNLFLNWCVSIPLVLAVLLLPRLHMAIIGLRLSDGWIIGTSIGAALALCAAVAYAASDLPGPQPLDGQEGTSQPQPANHFGLYCMLPLLVAALALTWAGAWLHGSETSSAARTALRADGVQWLWAIAVTAAIPPVGIFLGRLCRGWLRGLPPRKQPDRLGAYVAAVLGGALIGAALLLEARLLTGTTPAAISGQGRAVYAVLGLPAHLAVLWTALTIYVGVARRWRTEEDREWWSRAAAHCLGWAAGCSIASAIVILLPVWLLSIPALEKVAGPSSLGVGTALLGVLTSAWGYWSKHRDTVRRATEGMLDILGMRLLDLAAAVFVVLLLVVLSLGVSEALYQSGTTSLQNSVDDHSKSVEGMFREEMRCSGACKTTCVPDDCAPRTPTPVPPARLAAASYKTVIYRSDPPQLAVAAALLVLLGAGASWFVGVNAFSLHNMYCNRLTRAYLGATRGRRRPHWFTGFDPEDNLPMSSTKPDDGRLFHVINVALNLVRPSGGRLEWQQRKAASFTISPLHCGGPAVGYVPTERYGNSREGLSLGRAVAISGAAASPNMGYHSSMAVAFVMSLFNVRLGWWLPNTKARYSKDWHLEEPRWPLRTAISEALARTTDDRRSVYVSDGGHFENLGLYEMVRRRCHRIVVVDATQDPEYRYDDLESSLRKIRIDFGIAVDFADGLPSPTSAKLTGKHFALGTVDYKSVDGDSAENGTILYIKPVLSGDESLDVRNYAISTRKGAVGFPHQPTSDQFFDEAQFESYRWLGLHSVLTTFPGESGWTTAGRPKHGSGDGALGIATSVGSAAVTPGAPEAPSAAGVKDVIEALSGPAKTVGAVVLGSAIVLTGTVALKDAVLRMSDVDRAAVSSLAASTSGLGTRLDNFIAQVESLNRAIGPREPGASASAGLTASVNELAAAASAAAGPMRDVARLREQIEKIQADLTALGRRLEEAKLSKELADRLSSAAAALTKAAVALEAASQRGSGSSTTTKVEIAVSEALHKELDALLTELKGIKGTLDKIEGEVNRTAPRKNVRGAADGAKP